MPTIDDISLLDTNQLYSYADYLHWQLKQRIELLRGKIFLMSPAPSRRHQQISWQLSGYFFNYFRRKPCRAFAAPFDVRLASGQNTDQEILTVVQPDLCVICDKKKLDEKGCLGAPDLIVEILSQGNSEKELKIKYQLYEENGVREYWVVYPYEENVLQFVLTSQGKYELRKVFVTSDIMSSALFGDLEIPLSEIFEE